MNLEQAIKLFGSIVALVVALVPAISWLLWYFTQKLVDRWFAARADAYKAELDIMAKRDEIRFSKLHERRAEHIERLYFMLKEFFYTCSAALPGKKFEPEKLKVAGDAAKDLIQYFDKNKIYFSEGHAKLINEFIVKIKNLMSEKAIYEDMPDERETNETGKRIYERWTELQDFAPKLLEAIEQEFRKLLGVE